MYRLVTGVVEFEKDDGSKDKFAPYMCPFLDTPVADPHAGQPWIGAGTVGFHGRLAYDDAAKMFLAENCNH